MDELHICMDQHARLPVNKPRTVAYCVMGTEQTLVVAA